jgi:hypothetical protein
MPSSILMQTWSLLPASSAGPDTRDRFAGSGVTGSNAQDLALRINDNVSRAAVMTTTNQGYYWGATLKLEYPNKKGLFGMAAYTFSEARACLGFF